MEATAVERSRDLARIFMPYATERRLAMEVQARRFVHYTSAENAIKILNSKQFWMRDTTCMADCMEVRYGHQLLSKFFSQYDKRKSFYDAVDICHDGIGIEAMELFEQWQNTISFNTYIASISEHDDSEDNHGRLWMWRAFGQVPARAAIVIKPPPLGSVDGLNVLLSPVAYFEYEELEQQLGLIISNVQKDLPFLRTVGRDEMRNIIFYILIATAVSLKHQGFAEEREWRIIYLPDLNPSKLIKQHIEVIQGVPQIIYKIPLVDSPADDIVGVSVQTLVDRIIIGPSPYPVSMRGAFVKVLLDAGFTDAASRVVMSGIPLRT